MEILIYILAPIILFVGGYFTGDRVSDLHHEKLPPKTEITEIYTISEANAKNTTVQNSDQGQYTVFVTVSGTNRYYNFNLNGKTNFSVTHEAKTNITSKTTVNKYEER